MEDQFLLLKYFIECKVAYYSPSVFPVFSLLPSQSRIIEACPCIHIFIYKKITGTSFITVLF